MPDPFFTQEDFVEMYCTIASFEDVRATEARINKPASLNDHHRH